MSDAVPPEMFEQAATLYYRQSGQQDSVYGPRPTYTTGPTGVPCSVQDASQIDEDVLKQIGERVDSAVWFTAYGTVGAAVALLRKGSLLVIGTPTDRDDPAATVQTVVRVDSMGNGDLQLWNVYTRRRE